MACSEKSSEDCLECRRCLVLKYVRFGISKFLFSPLHVNHKDIQCVEEKPVSAGFINLTKMQTFGESYGLKLKPKKDDVELIKTFLRGGK